ncbi:MAG TPA: hypothetical protein LFW10_02755 [Rickettsia endosymbiont of Diachasma alloeum]|nr:hypothetical protein [Rickettsia endosymbiont of Diachasma alloeum]
MDNNKQDDKNVNNEQTQLNYSTSSNIQEQKENTGGKNTTSTPEEVTSLPNANIEVVQNTAQAVNASNEAQKPEVITDDPVENDKKSVNNEQKQSQLDVNIIATQDKADGINANKETQDKRAETQLDKEKVVETELDRLLSRIDKGEPTKKLEDAQVKNVLGDIQAQMASALNNYAELGRLAGALAALAASTNNPELLEKIKSMQVAVGSKAETAEQNIRNDVTSDNLEAQESIEQIEQKANIAQYTAIKDDFHKTLDEDLALLDAAINPSRASPEQTRILEDNLTDAEREGLKRKAQLKKEGYEHVYNIKENAEKEIEQNNTKITEIDERLKATKDDNQRQSLEADKQQYIKANEVRQKELDDHVKEELAKRDKERETLAEFTKLKERVKKYPTTAKRFVREHFELHAAEYDKNPDRTAINELHTMARKVGLAKELGVFPDPQEIDQIQSVQKIDGRQEVIKQDLNKVINHVHDKYSGRPIPKEETDEIANSIVHNLGYAEHAKIIAEKKQVTEITNAKTNTVLPPPKTPAIDQKGPGGGMPGGGTGGRGV